MSEGVGVALRFLQTLMAPYEGLDDRLMLSLRFLAGSALRSAWQAEGYTPDEVERMSARSSRFFASEVGLQGSARCALHFSGQGWNVYAAVLPRWEGERSKRGVRVAGWLWCEIDGGMEQAQDLLEGALQRGLVRPSMLVRSGGGLHIYWRLTDVVDICGERLESFERTLRRLAFFIGGVEWHRKGLRILDLSKAFADPTCCEAARILRVPGTTNHKRNRPVELGWIEDGTCLTFDAWRGRLPAEPAPVEHERRGEEFGGGGLPARTVERIACPTGQGGRHAERVDIAVSAARSGFDEEGIRVLLDTHARQCGSPPHVFKTNEQLARWAADHAR